MQKMSADNDDDVKINALIAAAKAQLDVTLEIGEPDWWNAASTIVKLRPHDSVVELAPLVVVNARLREQLARQGDEHARERQQDARERDEERQQHARERQQDAELIRRKDAEITDLIAAAMINVYVEVWLEELKQRFPVLDLNSSVTPSNNSTQRRILEIKQAKIILHNNTWLRTSTIIMIKTPVYKRDGSHLSSLIGGVIQKSPGGRLRYSNELDVHVLCSLLVRDALSSLGLDGKTEVRMENSFYSLIPDIVVVEVDGRIVFVIEVKSPEIKDGEVFENKNVGGQIWLYLMAMKQHGCERPMGAIMTFNKICLVSLEDLGAYDHHKTLLNEVQSLDHKLKIIDTPVARSKPPHSPSRKPQNVTASSRPAEKNWMYDIVHDPVVYYSEVYGGNTVYVALLQGILVAYRDTSTQDIKQKLPTVKHGDNLGGRLFARIGAYPLNNPGKHGKKKIPGLKFVTTRKDLVANETEFPSKQTGYYYMLGRLGAGKQGCCYVACNISGRMCCLKIYRPVAPKDILPADRDKDWAEQIKCLSKIAEQERRRWNLFYANKEARSIMLGGIPTLVMPYLHEIEINMRQSALKDVEAHLKKFASRGYSYEEKDLRWRHVLKDFQGNIFLADLGSLVAGADESAVKKQVEQLQKRMGSEPAD